MRHERTLHCYGDEWQHLNRKIVSEGRQIFVALTNFATERILGVHFQKLDTKPFNACNLSADLLKYMTKRYSETEKAR
jgi:hypothetical protein